MGRLKLRARIAWLTLIGALTAPARWIERRGDKRRAHELALAQLAADANARVFEAMAKSNTETVRELAGAMSENAKVLSTWLEGFKTTEIPTARTITEATELGWDFEEAKEVVARQSAEERALLAEQFGLPPEIDPATFWQHADKLPPPVGLDPNS
jgi:hypothetical protein